MKTLFKNAFVFLEGTFVQKDILVEKGKISAFSAPCCSFEAIEEVDLQGMCLVPGFIDIHTHGGAGVDVNAASQEDFAILSSFFATKGVTAYLASVLTDSKENTLKVLDTVCRYRMSAKGGATLLGAHLEGPFLSPKKKGAMPEQYLRQADISLLQEYMQTGAVKYLTVAPEIDGAPDLIAAVSDCLTVAVGHSAATYAQTVAAIERGVKASTHTFNAMEGLDRVEPHILGAVLESEIYNEIIADGKHVHPANLRLLYRLKGNKRIISVTDSIQAAGMPDGEYRLGINEVRVFNGEAFLKGSQSRAGSVLTMDNALKNLMRFLQIPLQEALPMLTENPADLLGLNKGYLRIGFDADFTLLNENCDVTGTIIGGNRVF